MSSGVMEWWSYAPIEIIYKTGHSQMCTAQHCPTQLNTTALMAKNTHPLTHLPRTVNSSDSEWSWAGNHNIILL